MSENPTSVCEILDVLEDCAKGEDEVSVGDVVEAFGHRSYGPFLLVPALIGVSPVGGIPGVPTFLAVTILLFAMQMVLGRNHLWLPGWIEKRSVGGEKLAKSADKMRGIAGWLDKVFHGRLKMFIGPNSARIAAAVVVLLCFAVPPLELLPFAVALPMAVIAAFGIALIVRDGLLMLAAYAGSAAAFYLVVANVLLGGGGGGSGG